MQFKVYEILTLNFKISAECATTKYKNFEKKSQPIKKLNNDRHANYYIGIFKDIKNWKNTDGCKQNIISTRCVSFHPQPLRMLE